MNFLSLKILSCYFVMTTLGALGYTPSLLNIDRIQREVEGGRQILDSYHDSFLWNERCPFPSADCGIKPDPNGALFQPVFLDFNGDHKTIPCLQINSRLSNASFAQLTTPMILADEGNRICLRLSFLIHGHGVDKVSIIQESIKPNNVITPVKIYTARGHQRLGRWKSADMNIISTHGVVRYKLNVTILPGKPGRMLLKDWNYHRGFCRQQMNGRSPRRL